MARACAVCALMLCGSAHAQDAPVAGGAGGTEGAANTTDDCVARLVATDARPLLSHSDPVVRGEAALIVAQALGAHEQEALLAMAHDPEPAARHRALIALGLLATPAAIQVLGDVLQDNSTRGTDDGAAAGFGLGLAPPQQATTTTTRALSAIARGSWKKQRDTLLSLLVGMQSSAERTEAAALRFLFDDESNREAEVRAQLLRLLLPIDRTFDDRAIRRVLERGSDAERGAVLEWLTAAEMQDPALVSAVEQLAVHAENTVVRARALGALTRARHLPSLEIAAKALRGAPPVECEQAVRSMLAIGGARLLRPLAQRIAEENNPSRKTAMIAGFDAPLVREFADHLARVAADGSQPWPLRAVAATTLARSSPERAAPMLRDVFRGTTDPQSLQALAKALQGSHTEPVELARLLSGTGELLDDPQRWCALLAAGHPDAQRHVLQQLQGANTSPRALATTLATWRRATVIDAPHADDGTVPASLLALLRGS